jgi:hypothetical protein
MTFSLLASPFLIPNSGYDSKSSFDKEAFAHQYATQFFEQHNKTGSLPFERILNEKVIAAEGLELSWFSPMMDAE